MPTVGIIIIGDEILTGKFTDLNTPWLIHRCRELGLDVRRVAIIPDVVPLIAEEVALQSARFDHVFTTGGVGPTHDDVTMAGVAAAFGVTATPHPQLVEILRSKMGDACNEAALRMAEVPEGSDLWWDGDVIWPQVVLRNVVIFPGVPSLLQRKFNAISGRFQGVVMLHERLHTTARETEIALLLGQAQDRWPQVAIGSYPDLDRHTVTVTLDSRDADAMAACAALLRAGLAAWPPVP